ncbi:unnamed protein product, partial [Urochloa humidicola]
AGPELLGAVLHYGHFRSATPFPAPAGAALLTAAPPSAGAAPPRRHAQAATLGHAMEELEEPFRKRARASGGGGGGCSAGGADRLSALPDCLIHVIMSFMKARQVVQTCVLSKRWKHLWHSVPCLDIDIDEFK